MELELTIREKRAALGRAIEHQLVLCHDARRCQLTDLLRRRRQRLRALRSMLNALDAANPGEPSL